jgi:pilus assembly protein CpaE
MSSGQEIPGPEPRRIFVTGDCDGLSELCDAIVKQGQSEVELVGRSVDVRDAAAALAGGHLEAVLHATRASKLPADDIAAIREYTRAPIVILASGETSTLLDEALEADVADVLLLPQLTENVVFAIRKASHAGRRIQTSGDRRRGRVITVFSPKGGTGKTVTATNLAGCLAKRHGKKTLLLDLDLQFGDAAIMLGIEPEKTIQDLVAAPGELDPEKLAGYTTQHPCGLDVLPAPVRPEDAELVTESKLARLLEVAREPYDLIIVDTSPFFHGPMLATLDRTDELLLVCGLDVPTIKNVRLSLQTLELLSFPPARIRVVLNRANSNVGLKRSEVESALEAKIAFELPSDRAVPLAVNRSKPVILADEGADFSGAIRLMARSLLAAEKKAATARRRWLPTLARAGA